MSHAIQNGAMINGSFRLDRQRIVVVERDVYVGDQIYFYICRVEA